MELLLAGENCVIQSFLIGKSTREVARKSCLTKNNSTSSREVEGKERCNSAKSHWRGIFVSFLKKSLNIGGDRHISREEKNFQSF